MTQEKRSPYEVLGVRPGATFREIKAAYRMLAQERHPDKYDPNELKERLRAELEELDAAWATLRDKERRAAVDAQFGLTPDDAGAGAGQDPVGGHGADADGSGSGRGWKVAAVVAVVAAAIAMGVLGSLLIGAGDSEPAKDVMACIEQTRDFSDGAKPTCPPKGAPHVDGLIQEATDTGFDLVTIDGDKRTYAVRPADRPYIDVQHAQTHASLGQPIRIYTKRVDGEDVIIYMVDSPLRFGN